MKKITSALLLVGLTVSVADAAPSYVRRDGMQGYNVTYDYTDKEKNGWYATIRAQLNLLNWTETYYSDDVGEKSEEDNSFEPTFGGSISVGKKFGHFWRGEIEVGYMGMYSAKDSALFPDGWHKFESKLSAAYLTVNALYDFSNGLYLGGGLGAAYVMTELDSETGAFVPGGESKKTFSPMLGLMAGYTHKLDDNFVIDFRYRIAGFNGNKVTRYFEDQATPANRYVLEFETGMVLENSLSVGLRYEF